MFLLISSSIPDRTFLAGVFTLGLALLFLVCMKMFKESNIYIVSCPLHGEMYEKLVHSMSFMLSLRILYTLQTSSSLHRTG